jgi:hypothetical protein
LAKLNQFRLPEADFDSWNTIRRKNTCQGLFAAQILACGRVFMKAKGLVDKQKLPPYYFDQRNLIPLIGIKRNDDKN